MKRLANSRIVVLPGHPIFATVVLEVDFIIHLKIEDELLQKRVTLRRGDREQFFTDVKGIQKQLEMDILGSGVPFEEFLLLEDN